MEEVSAANRAAWRRWLQRNHAKSTGVWLVFAKKGSGIASVGYEEAVEEALCFGWIDAKVQTLDEKRYRQSFSPRRPRSRWSRSNKERVARLLGAGLMAPAGLAAIERAKADGSWSAGDDVDALVVPRDLAAVLTARKARKNFNGFSPSARRAILGWVTTAKRPETRAKRIAIAARMAAANLRATIDPDPEGQSGGRGETTR